MSQPITESTLKVVIFTSFLHMCSLSWFVFLQQLESNLM